MIAGGKGKTAMGRSEREEGRGGTFSTIWGVRRSWHLSDLARRFGDFPLAGNGEMEI